MTTLEPKKEVVALPEVIPLLDFTLRRTPCGVPRSSLVRQTPQIWTVSKDWETAWDGWKTGLFTDLDVEEMENAAGTFTKKVMLYNTVRHAVNTVLKRVANFGKKREHQEVVSDRTGATERFGVLANAKYGTPKMAPPHST